MPDAWLGIDDLAFLDAHARRTLNHCRAFSYVHLLGHFEEFAPLHLADLVLGDPHGDGAQLRALFRFGDEELKHQQLFAQAERTLELSCGHAFARYFGDDGTAIAQLSAEILGRPPLARHLLVLALEWGTQRHYVESRGTGQGDPLYADVLRAHWVEEAQHVRTGMLEVARLAAAATTAEIAQSLAELDGLGAVVDAAFAGQAVREVATLEACTGRALPADQRATLQSTLHASLRAIRAGVGLAHPRFVDLVAGLARDATAAAAAG